MVACPQCPCPYMQEFFILLGKKWTMFIIHAVHTGSGTFTEIRENIGNANTKILTDRLGELVSHKILIKNSSGKYELSKEGKILAEKLLETCGWWHEQKTNTKTK